MLIISSNTPYQLNEEIRDREVRLIGSDGEQLGIMSSADARRIAAERDLDLVKISPGATPPVCKIMDYGKYKFEQSKREKEARRHQHIVEIKEVRLSPSIGASDYVVKLKSGQKFLREGDRLKVTVVFRGREMAHTNLGDALLKRFAAECADIASVDKPPKLEGRRMSMFLSPRQKVEEKKPKSDDAKPRPDDAKLGVADKQPKPVDAKAKPETAKPKV